LASYFSSLGWDQIRRGQEVVNEVCKDHARRDFFAKTVMSEDKTKALKSPAVLEQILVKLEVIDARLQLVESKIEQRGFDTKPIWEKALAAIMEVNHRVTTIDRKIDVFSKDMLTLRAEQLDIEERLRKLEGEHEDGGIMTIG
jgi:tetrahydromethanopterin S-methyltransferase subunit G